PRFRLLFDPQAEGRRYFAKTGLFPINHGMVVRRSIAEKHPWVVLNIFNAFQEAKAQSLRHLRELAEPFQTLGYLPAEAAAGLAKDPYPYGVKSNRKVLETIAVYSHEQGLTPRVLDLGEVFAPATMDL
ncbi:MAG TPA: ABC transporter substrate-binding protein, partial [Chloroflexota bacterium]